MIAERVILKESEGLVRHLIAPLIIIGLATILECTSIGYCWLLYQVLFVNTIPGHVYVNTKITAIAVAAALLLPVFIIAGIGTLIEHLRMPAPVLEVVSGTRQIGKSFLLNYEQRFRGRCRLHGTNVTLVYVDTILDANGKQKSSTPPKLHEIEKIVLSEETREVNQGDRDHYSLTLNIPNDSPPTGIIANREIYWRIIIRVMVGKTKRRPSKVTYAYEFEVIPAENSMAQ